MQLGTHDCIGRLQTHLEDARKGVPTSKSLREQERKTKDAEAHADRWNTAAYAFAAG